MSENDLNETTVDVDKESNQRNVFKYLQEKFHSQEEFSKNDVQAITSWKGTTFPTYWSKQFFKDLEGAYF